VTDADAPCSSDRAKPRRRYRAALSVAVLAVLGIAVYANSFNNTALFHHVPDAYRDAVLDNTMLRSSSLLPKIFTGQFLLASYGEYRPLGYALFALVNGVMPSESCLAWHLLLLGIQVVSAAFVFIILRTLVRDITALGLAAVYLVHPIFVPQLNDLNTIYLPLGILFSIITLWLFLRYARTDSGLYLLLSILSFAASVLTHKHAIVLPAFLIALCLFEDKYPRLTAAALVYLSIIAFIAGILRVPVFIMGAGLCALVLVVGAGASIEKKRYLKLAKVIPPYLGVIGLFVLISASLVHMPTSAIALDYLRKADLITPFEPWFVCRRLMAGSALHMVGLLVAVILPAMVFLSRRAGRVAIIISLVFLALVTVRWNRNYRDDVRYWEAFNKTTPDQPAVLLNLASVYIEQGRWETARDLLMRLSCEASFKKFVFEMTVRSNLGRAFAGLGNEKLAAFFLFGIGHWGWEAKTAKNLLIEGGDFATRIGYLSVAELYYASGLVLDPYDIRLYNAVGKTLVYKNFFRAAAKHFERVLLLVPDDPTALYYLAFIAKVKGKQKDYELYSSKWKVVTRSDAEIDFQPIFDGYHFDLGRMIELLSDNPMDMLFHPDLEITYQGKVYNFWEVSFELGKYFVRQGQYEAAVARLSDAHRGNPKSKEVVRLLAKAHRELNQVDEAERLERLLETMSDETQAD